MRVFVTGATGFIGRALIPRLQREGHSVVTWARSEARARGLLGAAVEVIPTGAGFEALVQALDRCDAVVNLRPAMLPLPALALKAIVGQAATVLLASQRLEPRALEQRRFTFDFPTLDAALEDIVGGASVAISRAGSRPEGAGQAANLLLITPAAMKFSIEGKVPPMAQGALIDYRVGVGPLLVRWRTRTTRWEPGRSVVDLQEAGPYRLWWHEHTFQADGERTVMEDRVNYAPPFGILGRLANRLFIGPTLEEIFQYRGDVIRLRFGVS